MLTFDERASTSPFVERVWRCRSREGGSFLSMPEGNIELVISQLPDLLLVTLRGPVSRASFIECPPYGEWLAIRFRLGTYFPKIPTSSLIERKDLNLPLAGNGRFWLAGLSWEIPSFESAEDFVERLALAGVVARSHAVDAAAMGDERWMSQRSVQRHFVRATAMTHSNFQQIQRARHAARLLVGGCSILDATYDVGYYDQAHLTRSLTRLIGMTPARLVKEQPQLSFSSKTELP
jgi:AraC-like DNA-binding protein